MMQSVIYDWHSIVFLKDKLQFEIYLVCLEKYICVGLTCQWGNTQDTQPTTPGGIVVQVLSIDGF